MRTPHDQVTASQRWRDRAQQLIPGASQTFSKAPRTFVQGVAPVFLERGQGVRVWDADGHEYLDYILGLGAVILGYADPGCNEAVRRQMEAGVSFSLPHRLEIEVAERLVEHVPCAEMVRFGKNGSDATSGAVRLARYVTGRDLILAGGYHGWQDWYIGTTSMAGGVPAAVRELTLTFPENDPAAVERLFAEQGPRVAAVILEPVTSHEPAPGYLEFLRDITRRNGALLIFDEIITGFRMGVGGAQARYGVTPDLACFGKAMGNGWPIACVLGPRDLMTAYERIFFSFTAGGEAASLAAAKHVIDRLADGSAIERLSALGRRLRSGVNDLIGRHDLTEVMDVHGYDTRHVIGWLHFDPHLVRTFWQQETVSRGLLNNAYHNLCLALTEADVDLTLRIYDEVMGLLKDALERGDLASRLKGPPLEPLFRKV